MEGGLFGLVLQKQGMDTLLRHMWGHLTAKAWLELGAATRQLSPTQQQIYKRTSAIRGISVLQRSPPSAQMKRGGTLRELCINECWKPLKMPPHQGERLKTSNGETLLPVIGPKGDSTRNRNHRSFRFPHTFDWVCVEYIYSKYTPDYPLLFFSLINISCPGF